jgi:TRAP-type C4-dicarboxylate transport system permease small subunit
MSDEKTLSKRRQLEELIFVRIPHIAVGILFLIGVAINIVNVVGRYVFSAPVFWAEEALSFMLIWVVFLVAGSITYRGAHLNMDLVHSLLPGNVKKIINFIIPSAIIVCSLFAAYQAWKIVVLHYRNGSVTAGTEIPLLIPASALVFGFSFMALAAIVRFRCYTAGKFD